VNQPESIHVNNGPKIERLDVRGYSLDHMSLRDAPVIDLIDKVNEIIDLLNSGRDREELESAMSNEDRITVNNGRRWLALAKRDDGTYEMKLMLGDKEKPLATLPFDEGEWRKLVEQGRELLDK
jgi:hypothetical protein